MRRGFTLIELMLTVAIAGMLSAMAAYTLSAVNELGRVNGASQTVASALRNTRIRAITERCTYVVQFNGPTYNPVAAPNDVRRTPNSILIWRKNDCRSVTGAYVPGLALPLQDRAVNDYNITEFKAELVFPAGVVTGNRVLNDSVSIAYLGDGTRQVWSDDDANGDSIATGINPAVDFVITVQEHNGDTTPNRVVTVPANGPAVAP